MGRLVGIHQPHYLPWLRYCEKVARCDVFILLDNVQFNKNGWQNRNRVKTGEGARLLTVPVHAGFGDTLDRVRIDNRAPWRRKHWRTIEQNYGKAPHFQRYAPLLEAVYARDWTMLNDLTAAMLAGFAAALGITTELVRASELAVPGAATERLVNLVRAVGGDRYYTGNHAAATYLDAAAMAEAGIAVELQDWHAPRYPQLHGEFIPDLAIVDLLMNLGPRTLDGLRRGA